MDESTVRYIVNVGAKDRVGIVADVADRLYDLGGNLEALSQTVVWGWFTMIICAAFPEKVSAKQIAGAVQAGGELSATVLPFEGVRPAPVESGEPFVITASGKDQPGIVRRLTRCFADKGINIVDVWNEVREGQFLVIFHVSMPPHVDPKDARYDLEQAGTEAEVSVTFQHQDIFTATNSLQVHTKR